MKKTKEEMMEYKFSYWHTVFFVILFYLGQGIFSRLRNIPFDFKSQSFLCLLYLAVYTLIHYFLKDRRLSKINLGEVTLFNLLSIILSFLLYLGGYVLFQRL